VGEKGSSIASKGKRQQNTYLGEGQWVVTQGRNARLTKNDWQKPGVKKKDELVTSAAGKRERCRQSCLFGAITKGLTSTWDRGVPFFKKNRGTWLAESWGRGPVFIEKINREEGTGHKPLGKGAKQLDSKEEGVHLRRRNSLEGVNLVLSIERGLKNRPYEWGSHFITVRVIKKGGYCMRRELHSRQTSA